MHGDDWAWFTMTMLVTGTRSALVDRSIVRSPAGVRAVLVSLAVLPVAAALQVAIFVTSGTSRCSPT